MRPTAWRSRSSSAGEPWSTSTAATISGPFIRRVSTLGAGADLDTLLFHENGHWREAPKEWGDPEHALRERQFFVVLEACVAHLPATQGRVFMMREWLELEADEICKQMAISATNLWVLLHRARLRLRECLQQSWFDGHR